jgi:hypothetical protein
MFAWVVQALAESRHVDQVIIVGLEESDVNAAGLPLAPVVLPDCGGAIKNVASALRWMRDNHRPDSEVMVSSADIPLLTGDTIDAFVAQCQPVDALLYYCLVTRDSIEARFPESGRTYTRLKDVDIAGGDLVIAQRVIEFTNQPLWEAVADARKHAWQLARLVGPLTLAKLLFRRLTIADIEEIGSRLLGGPVKIILSSYPELAMDADKPQQVELIRCQFETTTSTENP